MHGIVACVTWYRLYSRYRVWYLYKHQMQNRKNDGNIKIKTFRYYLAAFFLLWKIPTIKKLLIFSDLIDNIGQIFKKNSLSYVRKKFILLIFAGQNLKYWLVLTFSVENWFSVHLNFFSIGLIVWCPITRFLYFVLLKCHVWRCWAWNKILNSCRTLSIFLL